LLQCERLRRLRERATSRREPPRLRRIELYEPLTPGSQNPDQQKQADHHRAGASKHRPPRRNAVGFEVVEPAADEVAKLGQLKVTGKSREAEAVSVADAEDRRREARERNRQEHHEHEKTGEVPKHEDHPANALPGSPSSVTSSNVTSIRLNALPRAVFEILRSMLSRIVSASAGSATISATRCNSTT
jgi:hypothetical protein